MEILKDLNSPQLYDMSLDVPWGEGRLGSLTVPESAEVASKLKAGKKLVRELGWAAHAIGTRCFRDHRNEIERLRCGRNFV